MRPSCDDSLDEDPLETDQDSTDEPGLADCPYCGHSISKMAEVCPHCRSYISLEDMPPPTKRRGVVLIVAILIIALLGGFVWFK